VAINNVAPSKRIVVEDQSISVNVTEKNEGSITETFNVSLYGSWGGYVWLIYTFTSVTLRPRKHKNVDDRWLGLWSGFLQAKQKN
jgi:hypothetical protein